MSPGRAPLPRALCPGCGFDPGPYRPGRRPPEAARVSELTLVEVQGSGAAPGPPRRAGGSAESPGARAHSAPNSECPAAALGPQRAAPRVTCKEHEPRSHLPPACINSGSSPARCHQGRGRPPGPPSPSHPAASRPPPRRFPLAAARSRLVPPPAARLSVALSITHALLFRSLVRIGVTLQQGSRGEGGAGADGLRWGRESAAGTRSSGGAPAWPLVPGGLRVLSLFLACLARSAESCGILAENFNSTLLSV